MLPLPIKNDILLYEIIPPLKGKAMKIYSLLTYAELLEEAGLLKKSKILDTAVAVENITYNSKEVSPLTLFVCKGATFSVKYLNEAIFSGACCYLSEKEYETDTSVSHILVTDVRKAMALISDLFYDKAYEKLKLIGITGTKGKSTTSYYIKYIIDEFLQENGKKPTAIISTIETYDGKIAEESHLTTPEAIMLHRHFDNAVKSEIEYFTMEVSSQALKYDRVLGVSYDVGVFLNISEDHISPIEHSDFEDYLSSKLRLFSQSKNAVINLDCDFSKRIRSSASASKNVITFSKTHPNADYYCYEFKKADNHTVFRVKSHDFDEEFILTMPGLFNIENALAAIAVCRLYNIPVEFIKRGLFKARSSGRMEIYSSKDNSVIAIVDYAHNKLSFEALFRSVSEEYKGREIITVFGCPGNKAYNRRVELGELAGKYSDKVYLTADDPAYELVHDINLEVSHSVKNGGDCDCILIDDRGEAIKSAIMNAGSNSIILVVGKGSETKQKVNGGLEDYQTDAFFVKEGLKDLELVKKY